MDMLLRHTVIQHSGKHSELLNSDISLLMLLKYIHVTDYTQSTTVLQTFQHLVASKSSDFNFHF
jgi:hypothetical protein